MLSSNGILFFNIALYITTFFIYQAKNKKIDLGSFALLFYALIAIISFDLFNSPFSSFYPMKVFPFIFLYFNLMLMLWPLLKFKKENVREMIVYDSKVLKKLSILIIMVSFATFLVQLSKISISSLFSYDVLLQNYVDQHDDLENLEGGVNYLSIFQFILNEFTIPLLVYYLLKKDKWLVIGLLVCVLITILLNLTKGSRSGLVSILISIPFIFLVFQEKFTKKLKKRLLVGIAVFSGVVLIGFASITLARFDENRKDNILAYTLESYSGQSFLNFNNYGLDAKGIRYGDRVAPLGRRVLGMNTSTNYYERRDNYRNMLIDDSYFITFVGDFTLDFGPILGMIFLIFFSVIFRRILRLRGNSYYFSQIIILYVLYEWSVYGFTLWPYAEKVGNLKLIVIFFVYILLKREEKRTVRLLKFSTSNKSSLNK